MNPTFERLTQQSRRVGESNDCVPKAIAIAARLPYRDAHHVCAVAGRRKGHGVSTNSAMKTLTQMYPRIRFEVVSHPRQANGSRYTMRTIGKACAKGYYIAVVKGHAAAVVNGEVCDWTEGRCHRVKFLYRIVKGR